MKGRRERWKGREGEGERGRERGREEGYGLGNGDNFPIFLQILPK